MAYTLLGRFGELVNRNREMGRFSVSHFDVKTFWRKKRIGDLRLISKYNNDSDFSIHNKTIIAIVFVRVDKTDTAVAALDTYLPGELQLCLDGSKIITYWKNES